MGADPALNDSNVSVIIPAYNASATIRTCVASVLRQKDVNVEVIVVDDGSADGTAEIVRAMSGVRLLRQENAGPASARNRGIEDATGAWLAFLDADDEWVDECKLFRQLKCARRHGAVLVGASGHVGVERSVPFRRLLFGNPFVTSSVIARKDTVVAVGMFESGRYYSEDFLLWLLMVATGGKAVLAGVAGARNIVGRPEYGVGGLSGNLRGIIRGELHNFMVLYKRRLFAKTSGKNLFFYLLASSIALLKYCRRVFISISRSQLT